MKYIKGGKDPKSSIPIFYIFDKVCRKFIIQHMKCLKMKFPERYNCFHTSCAELFFKSPRILRSSHVSREISIESNFTISKNKGKHVACERVNFLMITLSVPYDSLQEQQSIFTLNGKAFKCDFLIGLYNNKESPWIQTKVTF